MSHNSISSIEAAGCLIANRVDVAARRIEQVRVHWSGGVIRKIEVLGAMQPGLPYLIPGFIDAHVHIESSMLTPCEFARLAARHGTVATVSDPHEIANVLGMAGVEYMLDDARQTPFKFFFGAPSCVPATAFETAGAALDAEALQALFQHAEIRYLSEVMNYPGVLSGDEALHAKLALARHLQRPIDGHAPGLCGEALQAYVDAGISSDHECTELAEAEAKLACGMVILIREGSAARNFEALHPLISRYPRQVMLCSDDKHPDALQLGHIDRLAARAVALGHDVFDVLQCACLNPIDHYALPVGRLRLGDSMDAVLLEDLTRFTPLKTWVAGQLLASDGRSLWPSVQARIINRFQARRLQTSDFDIPMQDGEIRVIQALDGQLLTYEKHFKPLSSGGKLVADVERDILWLVVVNRYQPSPPALAMIRGFGLRSGALASSVAHDSHNVIGVGADVEALCQAVNTVIAHRGGIACAHEAGVDCLPLPIAGLISDADGDTVAKHYASLDERAKHLGSPLSAPFMSLSFMALLVIPELKLSDRGLFDGQRFAFTSLWVDA